MTASPGRHQVVLVRHGATEWSTTLRHTGRTDLPLLPEGREQAKAVAPLLAERSFATVLVSPLQRARETCELAGLASDAVVEPDLLEWDYGDYEGRTTAEIRRDAPGWLVWDATIPGGESLAEVAERADRVVARAREVDGDVALVAHGHILRIVAARWCGLAPGDARHLPLATGALGILGWEHDYPAITAWNLR